MEDDLEQVLPQCWLYQWMLLTDKNSCRLL